LNSKDYLKIDGSLGEGGGAVLRLSAAYSILFKKPIAIKNIRANRPNPGLRLQHLLGLKTLANLTNSKLSNFNIGTEEITFNPNIKNEVKSNISLNVNTAASIGLLLQPLQIASLGFKNPEKIVLKIRGGGTFGKWAPGLNYLKAVTYKIFEASGLKIKIDILKHGFYPKGGGEAIITIDPSSYSYKNLILEERGELEGIKGRIHVENRLKKPQVAERILSSILKNIKPNLTRSNEVQITTDYHESLSVGVGVDLWCKYSSGAILGIGTTLGKRGVSSEKVGIMAANKLNSLLESHETVDEYASDQILPLLYVAEEPSKFVIRAKTMHFLTNLELLKGFFKRDFTIKKTEKGYIVQIL